MKYTNDILMIPNHLQSMFMDGKLTNVEVTSARSNYKLNAEFGFTFTSKKFTMNIIINADRYASLDSIENCVFYLKLIKFTHIKPAKGEDRSYVFQPLYDSSVPDITKSEDYVRDSKELFINLVSFIKRSSYKVYTTHFEKTLKPAPRTTRDYSSANQQLFRSLENAAYLK